MFDLDNYLQHQRDWSRKTFGPGKRVEGITSHILKELLEVRESRDDLEQAREWIDIIILALDGLQRLDLSGDQVREMLKIKQDLNFARRWPDRLQHDESVPIEHEGKTKKAKWNPSSNTWDMLIATRNVVETWRNG